MTTQTAQPTADAWQQQAAAADEMLMREVFVPVFLDKMAALGFDAANDAEAQELLKAADVVSRLSDEQLYGSGHAKQAAANRYKTAVEQLYGVTGLQQQLAERTSYQKAAELVAANPQLAQAAVLLHVLDQQQQPAQ